MSQLVTLGKSLNFSKPFKKKKSKLPIRSFLAFSLRFYDLLIWLYFMICALWNWVLCKWWLSSLDVDPDCILVSCLLLWLYYLCAGATILIFVYFSFACGWLGRFFLFSCLADSDFQSWPFLSLSNPDILKVSHPSFEVFCSSAVDIQRVFYFLLENGNY